MAHVIAGALKDYDWGVVDGLARWHGATGGPQAELWFGAHPAGPGVVVEGPDEGALLSDLPEHQGLPMVKLLAAAEPLSIQVHPDAVTARRGRAAGSALYADDAEKSEMLVALEPFEVHVGWRDPRRAADALERAGADAEVVALVAAANHAEALRRLLSLEPAVAASLTARIVQAASAAGWTPADVEALARVAAAYPGDAGVLAVALLGHEVIRPGDGIAVSAGVVHSYVRGLGVEVMTSSDNVLRLGLTTKPIAIDEALAALRPDRAPGRLEGLPGAVLAPAGMPFDLVVIDEPASMPTGRHRLVLALEGDVVVRDHGRLAEGRAMVWAPDEADAAAEPQGRAVVVTGDPAGS